MNEKIIQRAERICTDLKNIGWHIESDSVADLADAMILHGDNVQEVINILEDLYFWNIKMDNGEMEFLTVWNKTAFEEPKPFQVHFLAFSGLCSGLIEYGFLYEENRVGDLLEVLQAAIDGKTDADEAIDYLEDLGWKIRTQESYVEEFKLIWNNFVKAIS